jgi:tetratricopeptide (TPR) repeat protein
LRRALIALAFLVAVVARADDIESLLRQGDLAARADRHQHAIELYERAIRLKPELRDAVLPKLARQYLWNDDAEKSVELLDEYLPKHAQDCDSRLIFALASSWINRLGQARQAYFEVAQKCPALAADARLGEARVLRWMDRPSQADTLYQDFARNGSPQQKREAQIGLALTQLARDNNRLALDMFTKLNAEGAPDAGVVEGQAVSEAHLGLPDQALEILGQAGKAGLVNTRLIDLQDHLGRIDDFSLSPTFAALRDADGTRYESEDLGAAFGWDKRGRAEIHFGASTLSFNHQDIEGRWEAVDVEQRFSESFALRGEGRANDFIGAAFRPFTGELDAVITPRDGLRMDVSVGRILIADNLAALENRLIGTYASVGFDQRWDGQNTVSTSLDSTFWSQGSTRMRYRFRLAHRFEGVPRVTVEWPALIQTYNRGFLFGLFSPRTYVETGPGVNYYRRYARYWSVELSARVGGQRQSDAPWQRLGIFRASVDRELWKSWAFDISAGYSSSNLASPTGFKRRSFSVGLTRRF